MIGLDNLTVLTPEGFIEDGAVLIEGERIAAAGHRRELAFPADLELIDGGGNYLVPGMIDLQINGGFGADFTADPAAIWQVGEQLTRYGVTSYLPTIVTSPFSVVEAAQETILHGRPTDYSGATPLGLHLEGPLINRQKRGAHNPVHIRNPEPSLVDGWRLERGVRMVTLAPELPGGVELIERLVSRGILVSAGHSMASYAEAQAGLSAGIAYGTHLFNAMPALNHREPGLVGALLESPAVTVGLIADGIHVHPAMIAMVYRLVGHERISLVTDAMAGLGMPEGRYFLGDQDVFVERDLARLSDGRLAGCVLSLDELLNNFVQFSACSLEEALTTVTRTPPRLLRLQDSLGMIAPGYYADLALFSRELKVIATFVRGQQVFRAAEAERSARNGTA